MYSNSTSEKSTHTRSHDEKKNNRHRTAMEAGAVANPHPVNKISILFSKASFCQIYRNRLSRIRFENSCWKIERLRSGASLVLCMIRY